MEHRQRLLRKMTLCRAIGQTDNCVYFFFQAEDGIRDGRVTGVQTCALPISRELSASEPRDLADLSAGEQALRIARIARRAAAGGAGGWQGVDIDYGGRPNAVVNWERRRLARSEERRVGKEWRSRWGAGPCRQ